MGLDAVEILMEVEETFEVTSDASFVKDLGLG
jgi:acyl carrier protein